jgi:hypothetical protein
LFSRFFLHFLVLGPRLPFGRLPSVGHLPQPVSSCAWCSGETPTRATRYSPP